MLEFIEIFGEYKGPEISIIKCKIEAKERKLKDNWTGSIDENGTITLTRKKKSDESN